MPHRWGSRRSTSRAPSGPRPAKPYWPACAAFGSSVRPS
jgi:hypothetical protein